MKRMLFTTVLLCMITCLRAQVSLVSETKGTITLRSSGTGKNIDEANANAARNVFFVLLYRGVPESDINSALIDIPEQEAQQKFKPYLEAFFDKRYETFITNAVQNGDVMKSKHRTRSVYLDITVNVQALRKDLEDNKVTRKFGF